MYVHSVKKIAGLIVLYAVIIVGIFVLQFRNESAFTKRIGPLHYTLARTTDQNRQTVLKNRLQVSFGGLDFSADSKHPVTITRTENNTEDYLTLISGNEASPLAYTFVFSDKVSVTFAVSDRSDTARLSISASLPDDVETISLPYTLLPGYSIVTGEQNLPDKNRKKIELSGAAAMTDNTITFTGKNPVQAYSIVAIKGAFSFEQAAALPLADGVVYRQTVRDFTSKLLTDVKSALQNGNLLEENTIVAYTAAMAANGQYAEAIDSIPRTFIDGQTRSYLSAPYFDTLPRMYTGLINRSETLGEMIKQAVKTGSCDIFSETDICDYIMMNSSSPAVSALLDMLAAGTEKQLTVPQAVGILRVYTELKEQHNELSARLESSCKKCMGILAAACTLSDNRISLSDHGTPLSTQETVTAGDTLIRYGTVLNDSNYTKCGYLVINSCFVERKTDTREDFSALYPILIHDNSYYPHYLSLGVHSGTPVWAWTCAGNIAYTEEQDRDVTLSVDFPKGLTNYLIISGIQPFKRIQIYGMDFRTDPRFESYNSSGYVYIPETQTLLLKSRHKSPQEVIRLLQN